MRNLRILLAVASIAVCRPQGLNLNNSFEGYPAITLGNGRLELTVMTRGGTMASVVMTDGNDKISPLWNPIHGQREYDGSGGVFVCVDGFGAPSAEERAAGLPFHGEAHRQIFEARAEHIAGSTAVTLTAALPIVEEKLTRTYRLVDGENVVYVDSTLESLLGFDRPLNWAEHATLGAPFLEIGATVVDVSGTRSRTRPYDAAAKNGDVQRRLKGGQDFDWPMAPGLDGKTIDLRRTPESAHYLDHAATLLDPGRKLEWVTAINTKKHLILGFVFRREDFPWLQYWGFYPPNGKLARGMEFSTQPFDVSRRETVTENTLFGTPLFKWLPAKGKVTTRFAMFYTAVPEGFDKVDDVVFENGEIVIENRQTGKQVKLAASLPLIAQ